MYKGEIASKLKRSKRDMLFVALMIPVTILIGLAVAWLSGMGILPFNPQIIIPVVLIGVAFIFCLFSSTLIVSSRLRSPKYLFLNGISRFVIDSISGAEGIISGNHEMTVREAMTFEWPFKDRKRKGAWVVLNEVEQDVTDTLLSETEGILRLAFS